MGQIDRITGRKQIEQKYRTENTKASEENQAGIFTVSPQVCTSLRQRQSPNTELQNTASDKESAEEAGAAVKNI